MTVQTKWRKVLALYPLQQGLKQAYREFSCRMFVLVLALYPLQQGLKLNDFPVLPFLSPCSSSISITTRIETLLCALKQGYFHLVLALYPLQQGLKLVKNGTAPIGTSQVLALYPLQQGLKQDLVYDGQKYDAVLALYPLQQGLKHSCAHVTPSFERVLALYPLQQGLKRSSSSLFIAICRPF